MFEAIPQADLSPEALDRLDARTSECGAAFERKIGKFNATIIDAREQFAKQRQSMIDNAPPDERKAVRELLPDDNLRAELYLTGMALLLTTPATTTTSDSRGRSVAR